MGINRRLPTTDEARKAALLKATSKNAATSAANRHLTASTQTRLAAITQSFVEAMQTRGVALAAQTAKTTDVYEAKHQAQMYISHFFQVFNLGVARGKYPASERALFQMPVSSAAGPNLDSEEAIIEWGVNVVSGDAQRISAGGTAMSNPTTEEVAEVLEAFNTLNTQQSELKDAYDNAQQAVTNLRTEADAVIKKVWDETETYFNEETPSSMRRKCREWGIKYKSTTEISFRISLTESGTGNAIGNATVTLTDTGNQHPTDAAGKVTIVSTIADEATFSFEHPDYISQEQTLELPEGQTTFDISISMVHV